MWRAAARDDGGVVSRSMLGVLLFAFGAGIICAEAGGLSERGWTVACAGVGIAALCTALFAGLSARLSTTPTPTPSRTLSAAVRARLGLHDHDAHVPRGSAAAWVFFAVLLAFLAGGLRIAHRMTVAHLDRTRAELAANANEQPIRRLMAKVVSRTDRGWGAELVLSEVIARDEGPPLPRRLRLRLSPLVRGSRGDEVLWPGQRVQIGARIAPIGAPRNPGSVDLERVASLRGIGAQARLVDPDWAVAIEEGDWRFPLLHPMRAALHERIESRFAAQARPAGLALALAIGDRRALTKETVDAFRALGLSHLIAISGLHVGLVAGAVGWGALRSRGLWRRRKSVASIPASPLLGILCGGAAAGTYAWLSGASPAVIRAALAFGILGATRLVGRGISAPSLLCLVALSLFAAEPALLFDLGAELSLAACFGILVGGFPRENARGPSGEASRPDGTRGTRAWLPQLQQAAASAFSVSLAASFATAPWLIRADLPLALVGPIANLAAVPATAFVVLPSALFAAVLASTGLDELNTALSLLLWPAAALETIAERLGPLIPSAVPIGGTAYWGFAVGLSLLGLWRLRRRRLISALGLWAMVWVASGGTPPIGDGDLLGPPRLVFLDVGQGDAALVQGRTGNVLIDAGGGLPRSAGKRVVRALRALGVRRLDLVVITHGDSDHRGGASRVLAEFEVGELWLPHGGEEDPRLASLADEATARWVPVRWVAAGVVEARGEIGIAVLWPPASGPVESSRNDGSVVLHVDLDGIRSIFTADVGAEVERKLIENGTDLTADLLKVGHHGSRHSTTMDFLSAVRPRVAILSAPCRATRGLPHPQVFKNLADQGIALYWTGREGAITVGPGDRMRERGGGESIPATGESFRAAAWARARHCPAGA